MSGLSSTTAAGLARRFTDGQWRAVETGIGDIHTAMLAALSPRRAAALRQTVTIDLDTTDVEVYGRKKRGVAYNYLGQRCGRPHVATWAETCTALAADLMAGDEDPRGHAAGLLGRALAALPAAVRAGRVLLRADAGYFAGALARAALMAGVDFAIGAKRIAPLWRILRGVAEGDWVDAVDMNGAQVAVAAYGPDWWPSATRLLIRRVRLTPDQVSADPRSRRRRTLHPDQRALPIAELAAADTVYGYSFIVTNLDVSTGQRAAAVEHWYRHETLLNLDDVAAGHVVRFRRSGTDRIVRSRTLAHPAVVSVEQFTEIQILRRSRAAGGLEARRKLERGPKATKRPYPLRGRVRCSYCGRRMEGTPDKGAPTTGARPGASHPAHRSSMIIQRTCTCQNERCLLRSTRGANPAALVDPLNRAEQERQAAHADLDRIPARHVLSYADIAVMINDLGDVGQALDRADPAGLEDLYSALRLEMVYDASAKTVT